MRLLHAKGRMSEAQGACLEGGAQEGEHVGKVERHLLLSGLEKSVFLLVHTTKCLHSEKIFVQSRRIWNCLLPKVISLKYV